MSTAKAGFQTLSQHARGKADYYIDGVLVGSGVDWYSVSMVYGVEKTVLNVKIPTSGHHVLKVKVNGKTGSGYVLDFTKVWLLPTAY